MGKVYFCTACRKVFDSTNSCGCNCEGCTKEVRQGTPVNVIGTKLKGKVYRIRENTLEVLITSNKNQGIKTYTLDQVRKII